jgi:hypothetical protein
MGSDSVGADKNKLQAVGLLVLDEGKEESRLGVNSARFKSIDFPFFPHLVHRTQS